MLREYIVSEAMAAFGVPTTRALAAVATGETVLRQEGPLPGGVFTRVAASHIRVGTFQYFLARNDFDGLRLLANHAIERHYPHAAAAPNRYLALLESVVAAQAALIAQWMSLGFIHGVMNTDNTSISGETIDYGPCAFMDAFHPQRVFSSIDSYGRYAWGNQAAVGLWNLARFAETLLPLIAEDPGEATKLAEAALGEYPGRFDKEYGSRFRAKLGVAPAADGELIQECLDLLAAQEIDFTLFFRRLTRASPQGMTWQRWPGCFRTARRLSSGLRNGAARRNPARGWKRCEPPIRSSSRAITESSRPFRTDTPATSLRFTAWWMRWQRHLRNRPSMPIWRRRRGRKRSCGRPSAARSLHHPAIATPRYRMLGILIHGDNHFIVQGPLPDRATAFALARHWSIIQIGQIGQSWPAMPDTLRGIQHHHRAAFREDLEWAVMVPGEGEVTPAVARLRDELEARGITIHDYSPRLFEGPPG